MKKEITITEAICDICNTNRSHNSCTECGLDVCYDCEYIGHLTKYAHAIHCTGSGDRYYCNACEKILKKSGDRLFFAYQEIQNLRAEEKKFYQSFKVKTKAAERKVQMALGR